MIEEVVEAQVEDVADSKPAAAMVAEGRRRVCLQTAVHMLLHGMLLVWEVGDYAKYLEDYLKDGTLPRDEALETKAKLKRKLHS